MANPKSRKQPPNINRKSRMPSLEKKSMNDKIGCEVKPYKEMGVAKLKALKDCSWKSLNLNGKG